MRGRENDARVTRGVGDVTCCESTIEATRVQLRELRDARRRSHVYARYRPGGADRHNFLQNLYTQVNVLSVCRANPSLQQNLTLDSDRQEERLTLKK